MNKKYIKVILIILTGVILTPISIKYASFERGNTEAVGLEVVMWIIVPLMYWLIKTIASDIREMITNTDEAE